MTTSETATPLRFSGLEQNETTSPQILAYHKGKVRELRDKLQNASSAINDLTEAGEFVFSAREKQREELKKHEELLTIELNRLGQQFDVLPGVDQWLRVVRHISVQAGARKKLLILSEALESLPHIVQIHRIEDYAFSQAILAKAIGFINEVPGIDFDSDGLSSQKVLQMLSYALEGDVEGDVEEDAEKNVEDDVAKFGEEFRTAAKNNAELDTEALKHLRDLRGAQVLDAGDAIDAAVFLLETLETFARVELPIRFERRLREGRLTEAEASHIRSTLSTLLQNVHAGTFHLLFAEDRTQRFATELERVRVALRLSGKKDSDELSVTPTLDGVSRTVTVGQATAALLAVETAMMEWSIELEQLEGGAPTLAQLRQWFRQRSPYAMETATRINGLRQEIQLRLRDIDEERSLSTASGNSERIRTQLVALRWAQERLTLTYSAALRRLEEVGQQDRHIPVFRKRVGGKLTRYIDISGGKLPYKLSLQSQQDLDAPLVSQLRTEAGDIGAQMEAGLNNGGTLPAGMVAATRVGKRQHIYLDVQVTANGRPRRLHLGETITLTRSGRLYFRVSPLQDWHTGEWKLHVEDSGVVSEARTRFNAISSDVVAALGAADTDAGDEEIAKAAQLYKIKINELEDDEIVSRQFAERLRAVADGEQPFNGARNGNDASVFLFGNLARTLFQVQQDYQRFHLHVLAKYDCVRCHTPFSELAGNSFGACKWNLSRTPFEDEIFKRARTYQTYEERLDALDKTPIGVELHAAEVEHARIVDFLATPAVDLTLLLVQQAKTRLQQSPDDEQLREKYDALIYQSAELEEINVARKRHNTLEIRLHYLKVRYTKLAGPFRRDATLDERWEMTRPGDDNAQNYAHDSFEARVAAICAQKQVTSQSDHNEKAWCGRHSSTDWLPTPPNETFPHRRPSESTRSQFNYARFVPHRHALDGGDGIVDGAYSIDELLFMQAGQYVGLLAGNSGASADDASVPDNYRWATQQSGTSTYHQHFPSEQDIHWRNVFGYQTVEALSVQLPRAVFDIRDPVYRRYVEQSMLSAAAWRKPPASKRVTNELEKMAKFIKTVDRITSIADTVEEWGNLVNREDSSANERDEAFKKLVLSGRPATVSQAAFDRFIDVTRRFMEGGAQGIDPRTPAEASQRVRDTLFKPLLPQMLTALIEANLVDEETSIEAPFLAALRGASLRSLEPFRDDGLDAFDAGSDYSGGTLAEGPFTVVVERHAHAHDPERKSFSNNGSSTSDNGSYSGDGFYSDDGSHDHNNLEVGDEESGIPALASGSTSGGSTVYEDGESGSGSGEMPWGKLSLFSDSDDTPGLEGANLKQHAPGIKHRVASGTPALHLSGKLEEESDSGAETIDEDGESVATSDDEEEATTFEGFDMDGAMAAGRRMPQDADLEFDSDDFAETFVEKTAPPIFESPFAMTTPLHETKTAATTAAAVAEANEMAGAFMSHFEDEAFQRAGALAEVTKNHSVRLTQLQSDWKTTLQQHTGTMKDMRLQFPALMGDGATDTNHMAKITDWIQKYVSVQADLLQQKTVMQDTASSNEQELHSVLAEHIAAKEKE